MTPPLDRIDHLHVFVTDRAAAVGWYARVLGLHAPAQAAHDTAGRGPLELCNASGAVRLALFERPALPCRSVIAFGVSAPAFAAWRSHLTHTLGTAPAFEDHGSSWSLYFADTDGNPYEITCTDEAALRAGSADAMAHCAAQ